MSAPWATGLQVIVAVPGPGEIVEVVFDSETATPTATPTNATATAIPMTNRREDLFGGEPSAGVCATPSRWVVDCPVTPVRVVSGPTGEPPASGTGPSMSTISPMMGVSLWDRNSEQGGGPGTRVAGPMLNGTAGRTIEVVR